MRVGAVIAAVVLVLAVVIGLGYFVSRSPAPTANATPTENRLTVATENPPKIAQGEDAFVHDFDEMAVNQELSHEFLFRNEGEGPLELEGGPSTCKCTLTDQEKKVVEPGEETTIKLTWKPPKAYDEFRQQAKIFTNEPGREEVLLTVTGQVLEEVMVDPVGLWSVGPIPEDQPVQAGGFVVSPKYDDLELTGVEEAPDWLDVTWEPMTEDQLASGGARSGYAVTATVRPEMPLGSFAETFKLRTNRGIVKTIQLGVTGSRAGPITFLGPGFQASEMTLKLGRFSATKGVKRQLTIVTDDREEPLVISNVRSNPEEAVKLKLTPKSLDGPKDIYTMQIEVVPGLRPGYYERENGVKDLVDELSTQSAYNGDRPITVTFETNHEELDEVQIVITGTAVADE